MPPPNKIDGLLRSCTRLYFNVQSLLLEISFLCSPIKRELVPSNRPIQPELYPLQSWLGQHKS